MMKNSATLEELLEMRKLTRRTGGMDLERLNNGEKKRVGKVSTQEIGKGKDRLRNEIEE